jgi:hypothetical protein
MDPTAVLSMVDWSGLRHAKGAASDSPTMLSALLADDQDMRTQAMRYLDQVVFHQNTVYEATAPAALYVAAVLADHRTLKPVIARPSGSPSPLRIELLEWLGAVAAEVDDEAMRIRRRHALSVGPGAQHLQHVRPVLFRAVSRCVDNADQQVREAALATCVPLLDDPRIRDRRAALAPLIRDVVASRVEWRHRVWVIRALAAWGEDITGLDVDQASDTGGEQGEPCPWGLVPRPKVTSGDSCDPPF